MQTDSLSINTLKLEHNVRPINYVVVGRSLNDQARVLVNLVTDDEEVAKNRVNKNNSTDNEFVYSVQSIPVTTRKDIIETELLQPIVDRLQSFAIEHPYITGVELGEAIERLVFSDDFTKLMKE